MKHHENNSRQAFSLAEVVLALGLCSVALLSIVGLLSVSMNSSRDAGDDTALASMTRQVVTKLTAVPFDSLDDSQPHPGSNPATTLPDTLANTEYAFNDQGIMVSVDSDQVIYQCIVYKSVDPDTRGPGGGPYNKVNLIMHFRWPISASSQTNPPPHEARLHASIARQ